MKQYHRSISTVLVATALTSVFAFVKVASAEESQQDRDSSSRAIPVVIASSTRPDQIAVSKTDLYWVDGGNNGLVKKSKNGGPAVLLFHVSLAQDFVNDVAADDTGVYFATTYGIMRIDNSGGKPIVLASTTIHNWKLALDQTSVYWIGDTGSEKKGSSLMKVSKSGGAFITLVSDIFASGLAIDSTNVYWSEELSYGISKIGKNGGESSRIAKWIVGVSDIAVDETSIYAAGPAGPMKIDKATDTLRTLVPTQSHRAYRIAVDATSVYWTTGDIMKVSKSGGQPVILAADRETSGNLVVDDTSVYWTELKRGLVMRVALAPQTESPGNASTARNQERFDPQGEFVPHGKVPQPQGFEKIGGFRLWCDKHGGNIDRRSGVYTTKGATYRFRTITVTRKEFTFTTETIRGLSYGFTGQFLRGGVFREADLDVQIPVLAGVMSKYRGGHKVAEARMRFAYLAGTDASGEFSSIRAG